jgi:steroid delta-isomerase-like uncharacterized protein
MVGEAGCNRKKLDRLIEEHIRAEAAGDVDGALAVYTNDVVHDVVGWPTGPNHGLDGARSFYEYLTTNVSTEEMEPVSRRYGEDFAVIEHLFKGSVPGSFMGVPGNNQHVEFRLLHVWEFRDGRISRENVWLDGGSIVAQLTQAEGATV